MKKAVSLLIPIVLFVFACKQEKNTKSTNSLLGSWHIEQVHWITPDTTYSITNAQPGIFMVTPKRYSIIWTPTPNPRIPFKILSNPTEDEIISGFRSIIFNTGTYTLNDTIFNIKTIIAKVPGFEGGLQTYKYTLNGDKLKLKMIDKTYPNGKKPDWYGNLETLFIMSRID